MKPFFSVTIPAYKVQYLSEAIDSVLSQTFQDFELIIVNDHSPQDLDSIVSRYTDSRIRYYTNDTNCGAVDVVDNWNKCFDYANGDYLICMGDDDKLMPNCLDVYRKLIELYPGLGIYHGWTEIIDENSKLIGMQEPRPIFESMYSLIYYRWHGRLQYIGDFLFDVKMLKADGGFFKLPLAWGSDDIASFIGASHAGIANTQEPVFQYRINSINISSTGNSEIKIQSILLYQQKMQQMLSCDNTTMRDIDVVFCKMCIDTMPLVILKKKIFQIKHDMIKKGLVNRLIFWYRRRHIYSISYACLFMALFEAMKNRANTKS